VRREVNPHVYLLREFKKKFTAREPCLVRVTEDPKIYLTGTEDDFGKLAGHRAAASA
jgi:hypothetical protein